MYRIEGTDIVISGFEKGIADTPYQGIADMRNMEIIAVPGESSVGLATSVVTKPPAFTAVAFTAQAVGDTITLSSTTGLYNGCALFLVTNTATGLSTNIVYYVQSLTSTTFQVSVAPAGSPVDITGNGSGTLSTYQFGTQGPIAYTVDLTGKMSGVNALYLTDNNAHVWFILDSALLGVPADTLIFLGNIGGVAASGNPTPNGIAVWNNYLFLMGLVTSHTDVNDLSSFFSDGPAITWTYNWQSLDTQATNDTIPTLVSFEDGNLYWISSSGLGSLHEVEGKTFDPSDATTFDITEDALSVPENDEATCLAELGSNILIGGRSTFLYVWDKVSPGFSGLLNVPDAYALKIVATSQNAFIFTGTRGRIYITNGSGIDLYKKVPDYLTTKLNPFIIWGDANFSRNQLYFSFTVRDSANSAVNVDSGVWAIDLDTDALRMLNKTSDAAYAGSVRMITPRPPNHSTLIYQGLVGNNLAIGWQNSAGTVCTIDVSSSNPYTSYESYLETDMIPVGTFLDSWTPSQVEWKTSVPLVAGEGVKISFRTNLNDSFTQIGETTTVGALSDMFQSNFQKAQWVQFKVETKSTASNPSYTRLTEIRVRDWPNR